MTPAELIAFEDDIAACFERGEIRGPIHLSGGNEARLIEIFRAVHPRDWVFSSWRSHYHALLHGVPASKLKDHILEGLSMNIYFPEHRFLTSAIVGGILPIACGVAGGIKRSGLDEHVWCFVGDMAASTGAFHEAKTYAERQVLPITFVIEDNGLSTNTPTQDVWGKNRVVRSQFYRYKRTRPHCGIDKWVNF